MEHTRRLHLIERDASRKLEIRLPKLPLTIESITYDYTQMRFKLSYKNYTGYWTMHPRDKTNRTVLARTSYWLKDNQQPVGVLKTALLDLLVFRLKPMLTSAMDVSLGVIQQYTSEHNKVQEMVLRNFQPYQC
jgi:hypothetical protein